MKREIQREFDKHPISVPVQADPATTFGTGATVYNGPVVNVHGDHAQIAWGNRDVSQNQEHEQVIAPRIRGHCPGAGQHPRTPRRRPPQ
jgi:hypothetical protein